MNKEGRWSDAHMISFAKWIYCHEEQVDIGLNEEELKSALRAYEGDIDDKHKPMQSKILNNE